VTDTTLMPVVSADASSTGPRTDSRPLVVDEIAVMQQWLPLNGARVIELGCGQADLARRLLDRGLVQSIIGYEVDRVQFAALEAEPPRAGLTFACGGAQAIPLVDASVDIVLMLKSLHHVPVALMDQALDEVARVLAPGGWLYVSEPVYAGPFNDVVKLFHDEGEVRAAACAALQRAVARGAMQAVEELHFDMPLHFRDYAEFDRRLVRATYNDIHLAPDLQTRVEAAFNAHMGPEGAHFVRPMRVNLLRRPA